MGGTVTDDMFVLFSDGEMDLGCVMIDFVFVSGCCVYVHRACYPLFQDEL